LHGRPDCNEGATWLLPIKGAEGVGVNDEEAFREECRQVGAFLNEYGPAGMGVERWSDVAVLCPRRKWLRMAGEVFIEAGLPCRLVSQQVLQLELPEYSWPAALLYVLLNPWDRFELIGVLREIFMVSDVELADAQAETGGVTYLSEKGFPGRLGRALGLLRELHDAVPPGSGLSLGEYVERVVEGTRLEARLGAIGPGGVGLGRLRQEALMAEIAGKPLRVWVGELVRGLRRPAARISAVDNEMPLMTCQGAKGLEWPVVIPLGLGRPIRPKPPEYPRIEEDAEEIRVHVSNVTVMEEDKAPRDRARREENQRIFYVTLTRAKSLLVLPDTLRLYKKATESFAEVCKWDGEGWGALFEAPQRIG
jgi:ATP-dependent exoDNAse (exonuclease V) beta subunit